MDVLHLSRIKKEKKSRRHEIRVHINLREIIILCIHPRLVSVICSDVNTLETDIVNDIRGMPRILVSRPPNHSRSTADFGNNNSNNYAQCRGSFVRDLCLQKLDRDGGRPRRLSPKKSNNATGLVSSTSPSLTLSPSFFMRFRVASRLRVSRISGGIVYRV